MADVPVTSKLNSPAVSLSKIQVSPSGSSLLKDPGDVGKIKKQCTSPNKLKIPSKEPQPQSSPIILPNSDPISTPPHKSKEGSDKRPLEVPETIPQPNSPSNAPVKTTTSFFQRFFQR